MKYDTTPHKIKRIYLDSKTNEVKIDRIGATNLRIKEKIRNEGNLSFKRIIELSTDWETPVLNTPTNEYYIEWSVVLESFPVKLIPYVNYNVVYKHPVHNASSTILTDNLDNPNISGVFSLENLEGNEDNTEIKKVTMYVGYKLALINGNSVYNVQTKLYMNIYNPEFYI